MKTLDLLIKCRDELVSMVNDNEDEAVLEFAVGSLNALQNASSKIVRRSGDGIATDEVLREAQQKHKTAVILSSKSKIGSIRRSAKRGDVSDSVGRLFATMRKNRLSLKEVGSSAEEICGFLRLGYLSRARRSLETLRATVRSGRANGNNTLPLEDIREFLGKASASFEEIGISEAEYDALGRSLNRLLAENDLKRLRPRGEYVCSYVESVKRHAAAAKVSLEELGTSAQELEELRRVALFREGRASAKFFRSLGHSCDAQRVSEIADDLGVPTDELGITEEELLTLQKRRSVKWCRKKLQHLRESKGEGDDIGFLLNTIRKSGASLQELGTSEVELSELTRANLKARGLSTMHLFKISEMRHAPGHSENRERRGSIERGLLALGLSLSDAGLSEQELDLLCESFGHYE